MLRSPLFRIIGAILIMIALFFFLFRGVLVPAQPAPTIHSTLVPAEPKSP